MFKFIFNPIFALLFAITAVGQDMDRLLPQSEQQASDAVFNPAAVPAPFDLEALEQVVDFGILNGVVLIEAPEDVDSPLSEEATGIQILDEGMIVPEGALEALIPFLGKPYNVVSLREMTTAVISAYRAADLPVVDVSTPPQEVTSGVIRMLVIVGKVEDIRVTETTYFSERSILAPVRVESGGVIRRSDIISDLRAINRNPFRQVNVAFTPGDQFGYADMILEVDEARPWTMFTGYANNGNDFLGEHRFSFGVESGNLWGIGHQLTYQYTTTSSFDGLDAHAMAYRIPLFDSRQQLNLIAGYVEATGETSAAGETLRSGGKSSQISGIWLIPLPDLGKISHELHLGFDYKSTNNNLEFGGLRVIDSTAEILQFSAGQSGEWESRIGKTRFYHAFVWSPGDLTNHNSDDNFRQLRGRASADYFYWNGHIAHLTPLPMGFELAVRVEGQLSNANLLPVETLIIGGQGSVRGFEENIARVDQGLITNLELYTPIPWAEEIGIRQFLFYDYAIGSNVDLLPGEASSLTAGSLGLGLDYEIAHHLKLRASYGWQVSQSGFEDEESGRWQLSGSYRF